MSSPLGLIGPDNLRYAGINYDTISGGNISNTGEKTTSIFKNTKFYYRPLMNKDTGDAKASNNKIHGDNNLYDVSTSAIIEHSKLSGNMELKPADFAYLTNLGVYPNNRLLVCRRYAGPVPNDLTAVTDNNNPLATIVSWVDEDMFSGDFFKFSFGENWEKEGDGDLFKIFSSVSKETGMNALGGLSGGSLSLGKLTGLPEGFQLALLVEMANELHRNEDGSFDEGYSKVTVDNIPTGNPNLIREAMKRVKKGGLSADYEIPVKVKYEQKFINGVDPTIIFLDIIANVLRFGTSNSDFMLTGRGGAKIKEYFDNIKAGKWILAVKVIMEVVITAMTTVVKKIGDVLGGLLGGAKKLLAGDTEGAKAAAKDGLDSITKAAATVGSAVISKYKVDINAAINALMGAPSTPWHVTLGNPKKPFFASGDMYISSAVEVSFGGILAFNDLPSTIEVSFTLKNARALGGQEIFDKFNVGGGRSYEAIYKDQYENNVELSKEEAQSVSELSGASVATEKAESTGAATPTTNDGDNQASTTTKTEQQIKAEEQLAANKFASNKK